MASHPDYESIETLFRSAYRTLRKRLKRTALTGGLAAVPVLLFLFLLLEHLLFLPPWFKTAYWAMSVALALLIALYIRREYALPDFTSFYREASDRMNLPELRHVMDLSLKRGSADPDLLEAAIRQNLERAAEKEPKQQLSAYVASLPLTHLYRRARWSAGSGVLLLAAGFLLFGDALQRTGTFWASYDRPIPFEFTITPGDTIIEQGSPFRVRVDFEGTVPGQVRLGLQTDREDRPRIQGMTSTGDATFASREADLFEDADFFVEMDGHRSERKRVRVELLPRLQDLVVTAHPPPYTGMESISNTYPFNRMDAPAGSRIEIRSSRNKPLAELGLVSESRADTLHIQPDTLIAAEFAAREDDRFHFVMRDSFGLENSNPFRFRLSVIPDRPPHVEILSPERHVHEFIQGTVPLLYEYEDDYGFTAAELHYRLHKAFVDVPVEGMVTLETPQRNRGMADHDWDVSRMNLGPMDRLEYWIEITDNNEVEGYQTSRSATHIIEIPSLASRFFEQEEKEEAIESRLSEVEETYQRMQQDMQELRERIQTQPDDDWEQSQILDDIQDQRRDIEEQIEEMRRQFDELTRDMESQDLMSEETLSRYRELQDLMDEIDDPEILRLLEEMQKNLGDMDQRQLREQLENIEFNEDRYRERLERTMELFKSLRLDADLDRASKLLEELSRQESELSGQESFGEEEIRQQEQIRDQLQELSDKIQSMPEKSPERRKDRIREMSDEMRDRMDQLDHQMEDNIRQMQDSGNGNGNGSDSDEIRNQQQDMSRQMQEMAQQMSGMRMQMQQESISINIRALEYILDTLLLLSEEQEDVVHRTSDLASNSPGFIEQARRQRTISGQFGMITDSLYQVSAEISQFSNRINDRKRDVQRNMDRALGYLIDRNRSSAVAQERTALGGLNEIGTMLADLLDQLYQMENDGDGGGGMMSMDQMMEQMQEMSQDQQQLNQQIQDFINDLQGERLTQDHMERLEQMAREQNRIREEMRRLQRSSGRGGDRLMSEIERMAREMEDAINDLRGGSTDDLMVERQQNILSRMLEVEESIHKRDEDEDERLGETAGDYDPRDVPEMTMEELRERIRAGVQQTDYTRFREEYRRLIERYFQLMEEYLEDDQTRSMR
ncbi:DUF4175 family protein [Balneolales bacterium ANBcel1]|nr:DUF4175 family protein [Balneolales bacterium ANBcel1]